jgi:uncharacterized membrane protein YccC
MRRAGERRSVGISPPAATHRGPCDFRSSDDKRRRYFARLLEELDVYQEKLQVWEASPQVTEPVRRLVEMLRKYQHVLTNS